MAFYLIFDIIFIYMYIIFIFHFYLIILKMFSSYRKRWMRQLKHSLKLYVLCNHHYHPNCGL